MANLHKQLLFIVQHAPHGTHRMREQLDILLMAADTDHTLSLLFIHDGVFNLLPAHPGTASFTKAYKALTLYPIKVIYCSAQDLRARNIIATDLMLAPHLVEEVALKNLLQQADIIISS